MSRRGASHMAYPALGSMKLSRTIGKYVSDVPIEILTKSDYNYWYYDSLKAPRVDATNDQNESFMEWGTGSETVNEPPNLSVNTATNGGCLIQTDNTADGDEILVVGGANIFQVVADRPITWFFQGRLTDVSISHVFMGLTNVTNVDAASFLTITTGAIDLTKHDGIGFYWTAAAAPNPTFYFNDTTGPLTDNSGALTGTALADTTDFILAFKMSNEGNGADYLSWIDGSDPVTGTMTESNVTLTDLGAMRPTIIMQTVGAATSTMTMWRSWCSQRKNFAADWVNRTLT